MGSSERALLRDELASLLAFESWGAVEPCGDDYRVADAVLAVLRKRISALPETLYREDVMTLLDDPDA